MHHSRKKSGHSSANTSMTDVRRAVTATDPTRPKRPATLSRRTTPVAANKLGKNPRAREREWNQESWADERESFPQFCMTCEKQFLPQSDHSVYCSETCRLYDQSPSKTTESAYAFTPSDYTTHTPYALEHPEHRDIIPRASPSRPSSTNISPPTTPGTTSHSHHTSAISALRSLTVRPPSPPSPSTASSANIWPFSKSAATSPSTSYSRGGSGGFSSTYDGAYGYGYSAAHSGYGYYNGATAMDRPLPNRTPSGYSRPKSIELVTPMVGR